MSIAAVKDQPALVELQPGTLRYRVAGDFTRAGKPAEAPLATIRIAQPLAIMKHQVSSADYQRCVSEGACRALPADIAIAADRPAVQVSWRDADAYAAWLSRRTGDTYRLPTDEEWAYAAGSRYQDDGLPVDDNDPSQRWLARYEREADLKKSEIDGAVRPIGAFGTNENGLLDVGGNVWEWTNTCFVRTALDEAGKGSRARRRTAACAWSRASTAPTSPTSSATRAPADARRAFRRAISGSGWCASPVRSGNGWASD